MINIMQWLIFLIINISLIIHNATSEFLAEGPVSSEISFLAADDHSIYKALLFEGSSAVDMRWSVIISAVQNGSSSLTDFDFDATRRRLVFANSDKHSVSISECYLLRPDDDALSCSLTRSLLYRQNTNDGNNKLTASSFVHVALDWLTGDTYILLQGLFVRCSLPTTQGVSPDCEESPLLADFAPSIVRIDPFSRSLFWNQRRSPNNNTTEFCPGINRLSLTDVKKHHCVVEDLGVTSFYINFTTGAVVFTNISRDSIFQTKEDGSVAAVRKFANEVVSDSVVNCPTPVRSLIHFEDTDVFFWVAPDMRQKSVRSQFSQILAFEVDGLCSSHPTLKDLSRISLMPPTPRQATSFGKSTLTEQIRCSSKPSATQTFSVDLQCKWLYSPVDYSQPPKNIFFLLEIGNQLYYRTQRNSFFTTLNLDQLQSLKMTNNVALHVTLRVCTKWHCALPSNVYVQQSPFAATKLRAYRSFANVQPSFSVSLRWQLPNLFQATTSVTLIPEASPESFFLKNTVSEHASFEDLPQRSRFLVKTESCNVWNCSDVTKLSFTPAELKFEPLKLCWSNSSNSLKILPDSLDYSKFLTRFVQKGIASALYLTSTQHQGNNGSVVWIDSSKGSIYLSTFSGETRHLVLSPGSLRFQRHSLAFDFITQRLFWLESDTLNRNAAELHATRLDAPLDQDNLQHFLYTLPSDQSWSRLVINSTSGILFVLSGDAKAPTGALVFDLTTNRLVADFDTNLASAIDRMLSTEQSEFVANCQPIFDENVVSLYDNRVCFDLNRTVLALKNVSSANSISVSLLNVSNDLCRSLQTARRLVLQSGSLYLLPVGLPFETCRRRDATCLKRHFGFENATATFVQLSPYTSFELFAEVNFPNFNQSRVWSLGRVRTQPSVPSEPRDFKCTRVTPEEVDLQWQAPLALNGPHEQIEFILKWQEPSEQNEKKLVGRSMEIDGARPISVTHLQPDFLYEFRLVARSRLFPSTETSIPVFARCKTSSIGKFHALPVALERSKLQFQFSPSLFQSTPPNILNSASIIYGPAAELRQCMKNGGKQTTLCSGSNCSQSEDLVKIIADLQPKTFYRFCLLLNFGDEFYIYPKYTNLVLETGGFKLESPRVWTSFAGVEVLLFSNDAPKGFLAKSSGSRSSSSSSTTNDYQLLYSNDFSFCAQRDISNMSEFTSRNVSAQHRSVALRKEDFELDRRYWFRISLTVDDQLWISDCSEPIFISEMEATTSSSLPLNLVGDSGWVAATGLIAVISCASVVAFCLSCLAIVFLFRRINHHLIASKLSLPRFFCRHLSVFNSSSKTSDTRHRQHFHQEQLRNRTFDFASFGNGANNNQNQCNSSRSTGFAIYSSSTSSGGACISAQGAATMTLMNAGRGHHTSGGLWSLSTLSADNSPATATSSHPHGSSVFSFECENNNTTLGTSVGTLHKSGFPLRFLTLTNQIYESPGGLTNWLHAMPPNVLRLQRDQINVSRFLGAGAFGEVYEGALSLPAIENEPVVSKVAIKTLKPDADSDRRTAFCREAALMSHFHHPNIIRLIGMCIAPSPHVQTLGVVPSPLSAWPLMILELMNGGDLLGYLRKARPATEKSLSNAVNFELTAVPDPEALTMKDLFDICIDVAAGCRYLEKNRFCHRDIAARNCLVSVENGRRIVKIGDFGMARSLDTTAECYRKTGEGLMPVRWMSPESLNDGIFSSQSDIWSFGVLMFEVFSLGRQPYAGRANHEVFEMVKMGSHPECPRDCPTAVCRLMLQCFQILPDNRPTFKQVLADLKQIRSNAANKAKSCLSLTALERSKSSTQIDKSISFSAQPGIAPCYATMTRNKPCASSTLKHSKWCKNRPSKSSSMKNLDEQPVIILNGNEQPRAPPLPPPGLPRQQRVSSTSSSSGILDDSLLAAMNNNSLNETVINMHLRKAQAKAAMVYNKQHKPEISISIVPPPPAPQHHHQSSLSSKEQLTVSFDESTRTSANIESVFI